MSVRARILGRQASAVSVDGSVTDLPAVTPGVQTTTNSDAVSVDGPVTMLPPESPGLQPASATVTSDLFTLNTFGIGLPTPAATNSSAATSSLDGGAIAGGVVAAVVVAVIAVALLLRYRNKRSSRHWRNRIKGGAFGLPHNRSGWQNLDIKSDAVNGDSGSQAGRSNLLDDHKSPITSPVTAKFSTPLMTYPPGASHLPNEKELESMRI
ncbi:hypothetical protein F5879DRAFT_922752 [Lentinula edodes]|uniref:uncharacterized protein n=1 Tax=Lentinula edodes TaxID=5353 RepID=UPI001E8ECD23|nr:uncharacterized protein C8R40DRAFT_229463 [Lentinula edodes]KAH7875276.1 hypothetical protein C8R40DRAFT_229463 [Lentinula edodes]KAJ3903784.1 hypothetical protein F5879DRAFT_922752 [Lentinula edodes]